MDRKSPTGTSKVINSNIPAAKGRGGCGLGHGQEPAGVITNTPFTFIPEWSVCPFEEYVSDPIIPLEYTKINTNGKVGVRNEKFRRTSGI